VGIGGGQKRRLAPKLVELRPVGAPTPPAAPLRSEHDLMLRALEPQTIAAWCLGRLGVGSGRALDALVESLDCENEEIVAGAAHALSSFGEVAERRLLASPRPQRARALMVFRPSPASSARILDWILGDDDERAALGIELARCWRIDSDAMFAALERRAVEHADLLAVHALEAFATRSVPVLSKLSASPDDSLRRRSLFALQDVDWVLASDQHPMVDELLAAVVAGGDLDDAHLALLALARMPRLSIEHRDGVVTRVRKACASGTPRERLLGFRHLCVFARETVDHELAQKGLEDEYHNVAEEAALACIRAGLARSDAVFRRLCESDDVTRTMPALLAHVREDRVAAARVLAELEEELHDPRIPYLLAAARSDPVALVRGPLGDYVPDDEIDLAAGLLRDLGSLEPDRLGELITAACYRTDSLRVLVRATCDWDMEARMPVLVAALKHGSRWANPQPIAALLASVPVGAAPLLMDVLDALTKGDAATLRPIRAALDALRSADDPHVARRAIDLFTR